MRPPVRLVIVVLIAICCVGCDQALKEIARDSLRDKPPSAHLGDLFHLSYGENPGAFLGLGADWPSPLRQGLYFVAVIPIIVAAGWAAHRPDQVNTLSLVGIALLCGGGLGNLIDRLTQNGLVTDFMRIAVGRLSTGVFNVADVAIMVGAGLMILSLLGPQASLDDAPAST